MKRLSKKDRERQRREQRAEIRRRERQRPKRRAFRTASTGTTHVLDCYRSHRGLKPSRRKIEATLVLPEQFSFIDKPNEAIEAIDRFVEIASARPRALVIDHSRCVHGDHCAESVLSALAIDSRRGGKTRLRGFLPTDEQQRKRVIASGMPRNLNLHLGDIEDYFPFGLRRGTKKKERAFTSSPREEVTTKLTEYVDQCLNRYGWQLTDAAAEFMSRIVGEVIGNAEDHSLQRNWWASGYLHEQEGKMLGDCHLTIFNFGQTIYQSLQLLPENSLLRRQIRELVKLHRDKGFFVRNAWTEEGLWTLYALQEGVSRFNRATGELETDRGQGTAELIEFFQRLGQKRSQGGEPRMCIVSGRTHIMFDGRYQMKKMARPHGAPRRVVALNTTNDLREKPDKDCVTTLKKPFPGTLISLRFYFDREYLAKHGGADVRAATGVARALSI